VIPYVVARAIYDREPCARSFNEDLELHLMNGVVFSTADFFLMGRAVPRGACHADVINPAVVFAASLCDCWHVHVLAGNGRKAWSILPYPLQWMSFERNNRLKFYPMADMQRIFSFLK
jgi:hypothetical protein